MSCLGIELFGYNGDIQLYEGRFSKLHVKVECYSKDWTHEKRAGTFFVMLFALAIIATRGQLYPSGTCHLYPAIAAGATILAIDAVVVLRALQLNAQFRNQVGAHVKCVGRRDEPELLSDDDDLKQFEIGAALSAPIHEDGFKDEFSCSLNCLIRRDSENKFVAQYFETNALFVTASKRYEKAQKLRQYQG